MNWDAPIYEPIDLATYFSQNTTLEEFVDQVCKRFEREDTGEPFTAIIYDNNNYKIAELDLTPEMFYRRVHHF